MEKTVQEKEKEGMRLIPRVAILMYSLEECKLNRREKLDLRRVRWAIRELQGNAWGIETSRDNS